MFEKQSVREQYREAYRAVRLFDPRLRENCHDVDGADDLLFGMLYAKYGMLALDVKQAKRDKTIGIAVNWKLRQRLQNATVKKRIGAPVPGLTNVFRRA